MEQRILTAEERAALDQGFAAQFGGLPERYFSAPGRTEIGGNHTDHQRGKVLAGAVNLDTLAAVRVSDRAEIRLLSEGYPLYTVSLAALHPLPEEAGTAAALIRGTASRFRALGAPLRGFDAYIRSTVLPGSGLSSSAAFEVLLGTVFSHLFCGGTLPALEIAKIGQYVENVFFGKPCGLMDQTASAVGGLLVIDFAGRDNPTVAPVPFDFAACGHALCILSTGGGHADLTEDYAAIPAELARVCAYFGVSVLREVPEEPFYAALPALRRECGDRAVLRAIHVFAENRRVDCQVEALRAGDFDTFLSLVQASGASSWQYLQNVVPAGAAAHQDLAVALALCRRLLGGRGACRVHGGGFAGTVQAFVPLDRLDAFRTGTEAVFGAGACRVLSIRPFGGVEARLP